MCLENRPKVTVLVNGRARVGPLAVWFPSVLTTPAPPGPALLSARDGLPPISTVFAPSVLAVTVTASPLLLHIFSQMSPSRGHLPQSLHQKQRACAHAHAHTHPRTIILYSHCPSLFPSLVLIITCILHTYLYVCPLRAGTWFCSLL